MASVGPLLLLLLMSYILISTVTISTSANQSERGKSSLDKLKEGKEKLKRALKAVSENTGDIKTIGGDALTLLKEIGNVMKSLSASTPDILKVAQSLVNVIPVVGSVFSLVMSVAIVIDKHVNDRSLLKDIKEEFEKIDLKLDQYHKEQKWNIWAAGVYHKPELDIRTAWGKYQTLLDSLLGSKDQNEIKNHKQHFIETYSKYEQAPQEMRVLLEKTSKSFINNLGDELAEHVKCHEKELLGYTILILTLICKANIMTQYYYRLKDIESDANTKEMKANMYVAITAMFEIQRRCITNSMTYVKQDVKPLIDKSKERDALAEDVWSFLKEKYDRYDWMVVAYVTKKSSHTFKTENRHMLSRFQDVSTERITVSVARQVKGTHTKVKEVSEAIKKCISDKVQCYKVAETLSTCGEKVEGTPVHETYTAVHAYFRKAHQSTNAKGAKGKGKDEDQANDEDEVSAASETPSAQTPQLYTGKCMKHGIVMGGKFVVLIKSDEELSREDPCSKLDCGQNNNRGKCVRVEGVFLAMCQCNDPYYGLNCENDINDYETELKTEAKIYKNILIMKERGTQTK